LKLNSSSTSGPSLGVLLPKPEAAPSGARATTLIAALDRLLADAE
jgi:hypothetical protein